MPAELLTHTKRRDWKNCHRYYLHKHLCRLTPRVQKRGRRRGTIFGDLLFDARQLDPDMTAYADFVPERCADMYDELRDSGTLSPDAMMELDVEQAKMGVMVVAYLDRYGLDYRREIEFTLPLVNPRTGRSSRAFTLAGKIDGVTMTGTKKVRVIEDKLVQQIQRVMIERLPLDDQATEYVLAFVAKGWEADVAYRHTRWPGIEPKTAKTFKTKDDYPGETLDEYADRLREDVMVTRPEFYFDEQILWFPRDHRDDYLNGRWGTAQEILAARRVFARSWRDGMVTLPVLQSFPMNPSRCWEYGGCEFIPLCTKQAGAEALYVVQEANPELRQGKDDDSVTSEYGPQG